MLHRIHAYLDGRVPLRYVRSLLRRPDGSLRRLVSPLVPEIAKAVTEPRRESPPSKSMPQPRIPRASLVPGERFPRKGAALRNHDLTRKAVSG